MTKQFLRLVLASGLGLAALAARAQTPVSLTTSPYTENFDGIGAGLPAGFGVYTNASASSLGTAFTYAPAAAAWNATAAGFKNFASATGLTATSDAAAQSGSTNRALGVRQTGATATPITDPGAAFVFQVANTTGKTDLALTFKLQSLDASSARTTTWTVDYGTGSAPTSYTVVPASQVTGTITTGGSLFSNNTVTVSFGSALDNQSGPITIRIVALTGSAGANTRASTGLDDFSLSWNAPTSTSPNLTVTPSSLTFPAQNINTTSTPQTYQLSGANLTAATNVAVTGPFTISKDNSAYSTSLTYTAVDLNTTQTVYVKFAPMATGPFAATITHTSAGATTRTVALSGTGTDPNQSTFTFGTCTSTGGTTAAIADGWMQYSVTGAQTWACTTFGRDPASTTASAPNGVQMNGYSAGNVENEDWFISPSFNLTTFNFPLFQFWSRTAFNGPALKLRVSTNYSGTGNPNATGVTWTELPVQFPGNGSDVWTQSAAINLSAYKTGATYVAFVYTSTTAGAARWTLDDISMTNSATPPAPTVFASVSRLPFGYQAVSTSGTRTFTVGATDLTGNVTLTSSNPAFTLSQDGTTFASTQVLTPAVLNNTTKTVTVRFSPTTASTSYAGTISIASPGTTTTSVAVSGDTYDLAKTLEVANWNIEWFGSTTAGLGPTDKALQQANVTTVMTGLAADVYMMSEVVDTARLRAVVNQLSTNMGTPYGMKVGDFGSYADDANDPQFNQDQKLAFIYRKSVVTPTLFKGLLRCTEAQACAAYTPWASGRFPYLMQANVTLDGVTKQVNFIVIHAKANSAASSANDWQRRKTGADLLKAELEANYAGQNTLIAGDYNDVLNGTIATALPTGVAPGTSSYVSFVNDATNYTAVTLPLANSGAQSTASYPTLIDNVVTTKPMGNYYLAGTAAVRTDLTSPIANYANTTSDHYPIYSRYSLTQVLATKSAATAQLGLYPNPVTNTVRIEVPEAGSLALQVVGVDGRLVLNGTGTLEQLNQQLGQRVAGLASGLYLVRVTGAQHTYVARFQKQ